MKRGVLGLAIVLMLCMSSFVSAFSVSSLISSASNYLKMDNSGTEIKGDLTLFNDGNLNLKASAIDPGDIVFLKKVDESYAEKGRIWTNPEGEGMFFGVSNPRVVAMFFSGDGKVGIGTISPSEKLDVVGSIKVSQNVTAQAFYYDSDERLKTNISIIENPIEKIMQLEGVEFNWKSTGEESLGFIAQDVEKVFPEVVADGEYKSVAYANLIAPLLEAVKAQQKTIEDLTKRVEELESNLK